MGGIAAFALLTLASYFFIVLHVPFMIIPFFLLLCIVLAKPALNAVKKIKIAFNLRDLVITAVFVIGIAGQLAIISPSGIISKGGDKLFWSANGHDGAWHIALMDEIRRGWPFQNPSFAGEKLTNYHFFSDILPAMIGKYLPASDVSLYFRIFPFIGSLFLGVSAYFLTKKISKNKNAPIWSTIFTYFAGSFGYIVTYIKNKTIGGESIFWATQPQSAAGNPPQIASDFLILAGLYFYLSFREQKEKKTKIIYSIICIVLFGTLASFKVYAGFVALGALGIAGLWQLFKEKKIDTLVIAFISALLAAALYLPNTSGSMSFLIFQPWWYIRTMIVENSRLDWIDLELRRQFYLDRGGIKSMLRILEYEGIGLLIFFFGNLGLRLVGLKEYIKTNVFIKSAIVISLTFPLLFLQKGVASNTSQFLQYFVLFMGILAGISTAELLSKIRIFSIKAIVALLFIILMIPTQAGLIFEFYKRPAFAKISSGELVALSYIKNNTAKDSVIVTPPYNQYLDLKQITPDIWDWFDTSYVAAFSGRRTYFEDYEQADIMGYSWRERESVKKIIFENSSLEDVHKAFEKTNANVVYYPKELVPKISPKAYGLNKIFENEAVEVWKLN